MRKLVRVAAFSVLGALVATQALGQISISHLPTASTPTSGVDVAPIVQGGVTKKVPLGNLLPNSGAIPGSYGDATHCASFAVTADGRITSASQSTSCPGGGGGGGTPGGGNNTVQFNASGSFGGVGPGTSTTVLHGNASGSPSFGTVVIGTDVSGLGTGVGTALGTNVGTAGAFVLNGGALGIPTSGTLTNATGLPISTGVSGLGSGVGTALGIAHDSAGGVCTVGGNGCPGGGSVTSVATGAGLAGGTITTTGTIFTTLIRCNSGADITAGSYTVNLTPPGDLGAVCNFTGSGASAWTLGAGAAGDGFGAVNNGTANITITATGNINGASTLVLTPNESASIYYGSGTWWAATSNFAAPLSGITGLGSGVSTALAIAHDTSGGICTVGGGGCAGGGGGGAITLISTLTASNSVSLAWTGLTTTNLADYRVVCRNILPVTNAAHIYVQFGEGGTPTWETTGYQWAGSTVSGGGSITGQANTNDSGIDPDTSNSVSNTTPGMSFKADLIGLTASTLHTYYYQSYFQTGGGGLPHAEAGGQYTSDQNAITGIRVIASSGNLTSGTCSLYSNAT